MPRRPYVQQLKPVTLVESTTEAVNALDVAIAELLNVVTTVTGRDILASSQEEVTFKNVAEELHEMPSILTRIHASVQGAIAAIQETLI